MQRLAFVALVLSSSVAYAQQPADPQPVPQAPPTTDPPVVEPPPSDPAPTPTPAPVVPPAPAAPAEHMVVVETKPEPATKVQVEGYLQPQFRLRQDSPADGDTNGFRFARIRPMIRATTPLAEHLTFGAFFELELQPAFQLVDGFLGITAELPEHGKLVVDGGQMRVPISRQQLLSDSRLAWVDKAQLAALAPRRDLGARVTFTPPKAERVKVLAGVFNGEGPNQVENIDQKFLYAGRVELVLLGKEGALAEGGFGDAFLTISGSVGYNTITSGDRVERVKFYGGDVAARWKGLSGTFEYLYVAHTLEARGSMGMLPPDFNQNGWVAELNYLLPPVLPLHSRVELGARVEEIDRNDTVPIVKPGDPEQSVRGYAGIATYYLRGHSLKAQLVFNHLQEIEDRTAAGDDAVYDNDQVVLQITYRMD